MYPTLIGHKIHLLAEDLVLDSAQRRTSGAGERRALVHGFNDELEINYAGDYPSGVKINGNVIVKDLFAGPYDVVSEINNLRAAVAELRATVEWLTDRSPA